MNRVSRLLRPSVDYVPPARSSPPSVVVLSLLGLLIGAIGMMWKPLSLVGVLANADPDAVVIPLQIKKWFIITAAVGTGVSLLLLASSVGSLSLRRWGRRGMLLYAVLALGLTIANYYLGQHFARVMGDAPPGRTDLARAAILLLYPFCVAYAFLHPAARRAFGK